MSKTSSLKNPNVDKYHALEQMRALIPLLIIILIGVTALLTWQIFVVADEYQQALQQEDEELIKTTHRDLILLPIATVALAGFMIWFICWLNKKTKEKKFALLTDVNEEAHAENINHFV